MTCHQALVQKASSCCGEAAPSETIKQLSLQDNTIPQFNAHGIRPFLRQTEAFLTKERPKRALSVPKVIFNEETAKRRALMSMLLRMRRFCCKVEHLRHSPTNFINALACMSPHNMRQQFSFLSLCFQKNDPFDSARPALPYSLGLHDKQNCWDS